MAIVGTDIVTSVRSFYERAFLDRALPNLLFRLFGQRGRIPEKSGKTITWRRYGALSAITTPLTEGVTPEGQSVSITDVNANMGQYGGYICYTDVLNILSEDPVVLEFMEMLGEQAGLSLDILTRNELLNTTNVQWAGTATQRSEIAAGDIIDDAEIAEVLATFRSNNIQPITDFILPAPEYNTSPIPPCYIGIVHSDVADDVEALTGFVPVEKYSRFTPIHDAELGAVKRIRFLHTTNAKVWSGAGAAGIDVYVALFIGRLSRNEQGAAYGIRKVGNEEFEQIIKPLGSGGSDDPLNQRASIAWKTWDVTKILNDLGVLRLEHAKD